MRLLITLCLIIIPGIPRGNKPLPHLPTIKEGWYACEGETPSGKDYHSIVTVRQVKEVYIINWIDEDSITTGVGILERGKLCISYSQHSEKQLVHAIEILEIKEDSLIGIWTTHPGDGELHPEKWSFLRSFPKAKPKADTE